jgi:hypothetical protein
LGRGLADSVRKVYLQHWAPTPPQPAPQHQHHSTHSLIHYKVLGRLRPHSAKASQIRILLLLLFCLVLSSSRPLLHYHHHQPVDTAVPPGPPPLGIIILPGVWSLPSSTTCLVSPFHLVACLSPCCPALPCLALPAPPPPPPKAEPALARSLARPHLITRPKAHPFSHLIYLSWPSINLHSSCCIAPPSVCLGPPPSSSIQPLSSIPSCPSLILPTEHLDQTSQNLTNAAILTHSPRPLIRLHRAPPSFSAAGRSHDRKIPQSWRAEWCCTSWWSSATVAWGRRP